MKRFLTTLCLLLVLAARAQAVVFPLSPEIPGNGWDDDGNGQVDEAVTPSISEDPYAAGNYQFNLANCGKLVFANVSDTAFYGGTAVTKPSGQSFYNGAIVCTGTMAAGKYYLHLSYSSPGPRGIWWQVGGNFGPVLNNAQASVMASAATPRWQQIISTGSAANFKQNVNGGSAVSFQHPGGLFILVLKAQASLKLGCGYLTPSTSAVPLCPGEVPTVSPTPDYTILELGTNPIPTAWDSAAFTNANVMQFTGSVDPSVCGGSLTVKMLWRNATTDRRYISINCADTDAQTVTTSNDAASFPTSAEDKVDVRWTLSLSQLCNASTFILIGNLQPVRYDGDCNTGTFTATRNLNTTIVRNVVSNTSWNLFIAHDLGGNVAADTIAAFQIALTDKDAATSAVSYFHGSSMALSEWGAVKYSSSIAPPVSDVTPPVVANPAIPDATVTANSMVMSASTDEQGTCRVHYGTSSGNYSFQTTGSASVNGVCNEAMLNLDAGVTYFAQMRVTDAAGNTGSSAEVTKTALGTLLTDYFTRADGALGSDWAGSYTGGVDGAILNHRVRLSAFATYSMFQTWVGSSVPDDQSAQIRLAAWGGTVYHDAAILLRFADTPTPTGYYVAAATPHGGSTIYIYKNDGSGWNLVAQNAAATWQQGDIFRATAVGSTIAVYRNTDTTPLLIYSDPSPIANGRVGIGGFIDPGGSAADLELDDFYITPASPPVGGPAYYVDGTNGSDSNDCEDAKNPTNAKQTIEAGFACMVGGDTVYIRAGNYPFPATMPPSGSTVNPTVIARYAAESVTMTATGDQPLLFDNKSYITFDGFTMVGAGPSITDKIVFFWNGSHHNRIINSHFSESRTAIVDGFSQPSGGFNEIVGNTMRTGNYNPADLLAPAIYLESQSNLIENNDISQTKGYCIQLYTGVGYLRTDNSIVRFNWCHDSTFDTGKTGGAGLNLYSGDNLQAYGNIFSNNEASPTGGDGVISVSDATNAKIYNNTFYHNQSVAINLQASASGASVKNNILWENCQATLTCDWPHTEIVDGGNATTLSNNLCTSAATGCSVTSDPQFVDEGNDNYQIGSGSPAKDAGTDLGSPYNVDKDNVTRPTGAPWEIGAYEYVP